MANIIIKRLSDNQDCETCGHSFADGARVFIDGEFAFELTPRAYCFDGDSWEDAAIYAAVLKHLGHTVEDKALPVKETVDGGRSIDIGRRYDQARAAVLKGPQG